METKICKYCQSEIPKKAKICKNCKKKQGIGCLPIIGIFILFIIVIGILTPKDSEPKKVGNINSETDVNNSTNVYSVGDIIEDKNYKLTFISAKKYVSDNQFITPSENTEFWKMEFEFENIGSQDITLSSMLGWTCYADNYTANQKFIDMDNDLSGTISTGKHLKGCIFFEIPKNAKSIELEYKDNFLLDKKITFKVK